MTRAQKLNITKFPYYERDSNGNLTYTEYSDGYWVEREFDSKSDKTYMKSSHGVIWGTKRSTKSPLHNTIIVIDGIEYKLKQRK